MSEPRKTASVTVKYKRALATNELTIVIAIEDANGCEVEATLDPESFARVIAGEMRVPAAAVWHTPTEGVW